MCEYLTVGHLPWFLWWPGVVILIWSFIAPSEKTVKAIRFFMYSLMVYAVAGLVTHIFSLC